MFPRENDKKEQGSGGQLERRSLKCFSVGVHGCLCTWEVTGLERMSESPSFFLRQGLTVLELLK